MPAPVVWIEFDGCGDLEEAAEALRAALDESAGVLAEHMEGSPRAAAFASIEEKFNAMESTALLEVITCALAAFREVRK